MVLIRKTRYRPGDISGNCKLCLLGMPKRTRFTYEQHAVLTLIFNLGTTTPTRVERNQIERFSGLHSRVIQVWFQNERQRRKLEAYTVVEELNAIRRRDQCRVSDSSSCSSSPR